MIRKSHVSMEFKGDSVGQKITFGAGVATGIGDNVATFVTPDVPVGTLTTVNNGLQTAAEGAGTGDHQKMAELHDAEVLWDSTFGTEADYVDRIANGNVATIIMGGYKATKSETSPAQIPGVLTVLEARVNPVAGGIHVEVAFDDAVKNILYFISTSSAPIVLNNNQFSLADNPTVIAIISDGHRKVDFSNLPSKASLFLSVAGQNTAGIGLASQPMSITTL